MDQIPEPEPDFDVIVVGAGIAGCVTAYQLAKEGHSVCIVERGEEPGSKNMSGGVFYCQQMQQIFPDFLDEAPLERRIIRNYVCFLNQDSSVAVDYQDARLAEPVNAVTVLRAKLDPWLAAQCESVGVALLSGVKVDRLLTNSRDGVRYVTGVQAGDDELHARVVVAADGVNSFVAREIGLRRKPATNQLATGLKAVISLSPEQIEDRFGVANGEGAALAIVGDCTEGIGGGGFCYTNADSVSVGLVLRLDDLVAQGKSSFELFDRFLNHPAMQRYLNGGEVVEYGAHLVAEGGQEMVGEIVSNGLVVVGDAAGLTLNTGFTVRGMDLAAGSGLAAATGISAALASGDVSAAGLVGYPKALAESFVGKDMATYAKAPHFLETPRMYREYGQVLADILKNVYGLDGRPRRHLVQEAMAALKNSPVKLSQLAKDGIRGVRAL